MPTVIDCEYLQARVEAKKALILALDTAITALVGGAQSYSLDTGQTRQTVTRANLTELRRMLESAENDLSVLDARLNGAGVRVIPAF